MCLSPMKDSIRIQSFTGSTLNQYIPALATLRMKVFREYPYLYDGSLEYEQEYLQTYSKAPNAIVVIAFNGDHVIGASTGMPMEYETENVKQLWSDRGYNLKEIFYFGESVLLPEYRRQGIGVEFFHHREKWAASNGYRLMTFCAVVRPENHPLKPNNYKPLDTFWENRGFTTTDDLTCRMTWQDIDQTTETEKRLRFWVKSLL
jgi:GNAT superfamily N-acetyltransferase